MHGFPANPHLHLLSFSAKYMSVTGRDRETRGAGRPDGRVGRGLKELEDLDRVFDALAHATRRHILLVIRFRENRMTAGAIARRFSHSWPTTTRHLRVLEKAGLVHVEKQGRERIYSVDTGRLRGVAGGWLGWFDETPPRPARKSRKRPGKKGARR